MKKTALFCLVLLLFLAGCSSKQTVQEKFNVSFLDAVHDDVFIDSANKTVDRISFILVNNEEFDLECGIITDMGNGTNSSSKHGVVGLVGAGQRKNVSIGLDMYFGETDISIRSDCRRT